MRRTIRALAAAALMVLAPGAATPQTATLVADRISLAGDGALVAEGHVEVTYEGIRLTATRVRYDRAGEVLSIDGPLVLTEGGDTIILASSAEMSSSLRDGILTSARLVLDREMQLAAARIDRKDGRYTRLSRVAASSCEICDGEAPLWEIRARRVIRDEQEQQLYFDNAQFRVMGVPVFYVPSLRLPDPSLKRSAGFLVPGIRSRTRLGTGVVTPYFLPFGDHADLTFSPFISGATTTLGAAYRQELAHGTLSFDGALSSDDIEPDNTRAYLFARGEFDLPRDFTLGFDLELVSDDSYLYDYGITERDRLTSGVDLSRVRDDQWVRAEALSLRTLRSSELATADEIPSRLLDFGISQRVLEDPVWGQAWLGLSGSALHRTSNADGVGRDLRRITGDLNWETSRILGAGFVASAEAGLMLDHYVIDQDSSFPDTADRILPQAAISLAWPFQKNGAGGLRYLVEPKVQLVWSEIGGDSSVPNEDSTEVEFDEGNLFALSRYPGIDAREIGLRTNLGLTWTRFDPDGWSLGVTAGRIVRFDQRAQFAGGTGIAGGLSDWLVGGVLKFDDRLNLVSRTLIDDNLDISRSETRLAWSDDRVTLEGTHLWRGADPTDGRPDDISELALDGSYRLDEFWTTDGGLRFNADEGKTTRASLGVRYANECIAVGLSLSRRFTSSTNVEPVTDIDLRVSLTGFGTGGDPRRARRSCSG